MVRIARQMRNLAGRNPFYIVPPRPVHSDTFPTYFAGRKLLVLRCACRAAPPRRALPFAACTVVGPSGLVGVSHSPLSICLLFQRPPPSPSSPSLRPLVGFSPPARSSCVSCGVRAEQPSTAMDTPSHVLSNATQQVSNTHAHAPSRPSLCRARPLVGFREGPPARLHRFSRTFFKFSQRAKER